MKTILVTGCAGFIGSHVAEALLTRGDHVIGVDEVNNYYSVEQKEENLKILSAYEKFTFYKADIADLDSLKKVFSSHDIKYVAHLAARAGVRPSIENPFIYERSNVLGTLNLLELSKEVKNFVLTSSSSVYGNRDKTPFSESDNVDKPISPYAASKKSCELLGYTYHHLYGMNVNVVRPFTIYGPRGRPDMAPYLFTQWVLEGKPIKRFGDGTSSRDYTYISDFVDGFVKALDTPLGYEIFNLGNDNPTSLNEFISTVERVTGKKAEIEEHPAQPGDVNITCADITKAREKLGYNPQVKIEQGLREFYEWYKNQ